MSSLQKVPRIKDKNLFQIISNFQNNMLGFIEDNFATIGPTVRVKIFHKNVIFTKDPEWIDHVFRTNHKKYYKGRAFEQLKPAIGEGLLTSEDELWRRQRKLAMPTFYKKRLEGFMDLMVKIIDGYIEKWKLERGTGKQVLFTQELLDLTSDIVMTTLLGENFRDDLPDVSKLIVAMQEYIIKLIRIPFYKPYSRITGEYNKFLKVRQKFDEVIYPIITARVESGKHYDDLLGMLMDARDEETGEGMSIQQLRDEFITIFIAGHETTAFSLSWAFYLLGSNKEKYDQLKNEAQSFDFKEHISLADWASMKYAQAVSKEAMRLYAPAYYVSRQAREDDVIQNYKIKKDDAVILSVYHLQRDPQFWEHAMEFKPERFLTEKMSENERNYYFPFGAGPRKCMGNNFALMEAALVLMRFFKHLDFELVEDHPVEPLPIITLRPKDGIMVRFI